MAAADFPENPTKPARNGVPSSSRTRTGSTRATFTFHGKTYALPINSGAHSIHGFAAGASWDVVGQSADGGEAALTGRYQISKNTPEMRAHWPTDAVLQIRYALSGPPADDDRLGDQPDGRRPPLRVRHPPLFPAPVRPTADDPAKTRVVVPASEYWVLDGYIPTGERRPVDDRLDFRKGQADERLEARRRADRA